MNFSANCCCYYIAYTLSSALGLSKRIEKVHYIDISEREQYYVMFTAKTGLFSQIYFKKIKKN